jgi:ketosteroid isomerase-like protein
MFSRKVLIMTTRDVVEEFFGLLAGGDPDKVAEVFADDIDWYVPGSASLPWTGPRTKRSEVADYFRTLGANIGIRRVSGLGRTGMSAGACAWARVNSVRRVA